MRPKSVKISLSLDQSRNLESGRILRRFHWHGLKATSGLPKLQLSFKTKRISITSMSSKQKEVISSGKLVPTELLIFTLLGTQQLQSSSLQKVRKSWKDTKFRCRVVWPTWELTMFGKNTQSSSKSLIQFSTTKVKWVFSSVETAHTCRSTKWSSPNTQRNGSSRNMEETLPLGKCQFPLIILMVIVMASILNTLAHRYITHTRRKMQVVMLSRKESHTDFSELIIQLSTMEDLDTLA